VELFSFCKKIREIDRAIEMIGFNIKKKSAAVEDKSA